MMSLDFFDPFPRISTPRLELRPITHADAEALFDLFSDERVMEYWSCLPYRSIDEARSLIDMIEEAYQNRRGIEWGIAEKGADRLIGKCAFHRIERRHFRAEVGYAIAPPFWGSGRMREAMSALIGFGFGPMNLHSIEAQVTPGNERSVRALERLGFQKEGHLRENYCMAGTFSDTLIFSLLERAHAGREP